MAESRQHKELVRRIVSYIEAMPNCCHDFIEADLFDFNTRTSRVVGGYFPDVFYKDDSQIIIGEAKTEADLQTPHTDKQIASYIAECKLFSGDRHIVLSVPFFASNSLFNYINRRIENYHSCNIKFHLINDSDLVDIVCL